MNTYKNAAIATVVILAVYFTLVAHAEGAWRYVYVPAGSLVGVWVSAWCEHKGKRSPAAPKAIARRLKRPAPGVPAHLINRVAGLGGVDPATAERLIRLIALRHKDRPLQWAADKALMDLERDRR
jgi:hypothetical protein